MTVSVGFNHNIGTSFLEIFGDKGTTRITYQGDHENNSTRYSMNDSYELQKAGKKVMKKYGSLSGDISPKAFDSVVKHMVIQEVEKVSEKYEARVDAVYASHWGGVDIDGLNEDAMLAHWQRFNANARKPTAEFFKGSAFGWPGEKARTSHSFMARLLSVGLPPALKNSVSIGVKTYWTAHDVQVYGEAIYKKLHRR